MRATLTLKELNFMVKETIELTLPDTYWVEAELSDAHESNGHCYMELIEKDKRGNAIIARASARCWRNTWQLARPHFERVTGERLHAGMKVLLQVYAQFHETYGFSWIVNDIDPTFTLGDMARKRQEIILKLKEEGVFDLNKELTLPLFTQRIAVITSSTAAGYGDFCNQLTNNPYGFCFKTALFQATMQGENTERSIIKALDLINENIEDFDCVVIIRGGGAVSDLSCFDSLAIAENVANFPLPVITGIGHDRDESVLDMVAHTRVKTPTAAAVLLIDNLKNVSDRINANQNSLVNGIRRLMETEHARIERIATNIPMAFSLIKMRQFATLDNFLARMNTAAKQQINLNRHRLEVLSTTIRPVIDRRMATELHRMALLLQRVSALDPVLLLRRGYSITLYKGHVLHDSTLLNEGDEIETHLAKGSVKSIVKKKR